MTLEQTPLREAAEMEYRCFVNAAAMFQIANACDRRFKALGAATVLLTTLAAGSVSDAVGTILKSLSFNQPFITALLVISLGVSSALLNFLDPKASRDGALLTGRQLGQLRDTLRLMRVQIVKNTIDDQELIKELKVAQKRYAEIEATMLPIPDKVHLAVKVAQETNLHYRELRNLTGRPVPGPASM